MSPFYANSRQLTSTAGKECPEQSPVNACDLSQIHFKYASSCSPRLGMLGQRDLAAGRRAADGDLRPNDASGSNQCLDRTTEH